MYESLEDDKKPSEVELLRFMIDTTYQGKGIGRKAFELALKNITEVKSPRKIYICFSKENIAASALYTSFGFVDNGVDEYGQINLVFET